MVSVDTHLAMRADLFGDEAIRVLRVIPNHRHARSRSLTFAEDVLRANPMTSRTTPLSPEVS
jgi:hypothetical protein